jgi:dTDP-L-rhamnose 4-epimerase
MRALVTGGAGFIGSQIVDRFLQQGYEVRVIDVLDPRVHPGGLPRYFPKDAEFIKGSVTDRTTWERAVVDVDVISHQAAYQDYMLDFSKFLCVNAVSTALLYEVLVERCMRPEKVIVASSQSVYGEGQYVCPTHGQVLALARGQEQLQQKNWAVHCPICDEVVSPKLLQEDYTNPINQYAVSKLSGEKIALGLGRIHQIPTVALRYSITQGPRQSLFNQYSGILRIFFTRARSRKPLVIYEDGRQTRDFVHVQDVVDANFSVLEKDCNYEAFNVGSGMAVSVLEYAELMMGTLGSDTQLSIPGQYRIGDNRHSVSSVEKIKKLGWRPQRNLQQTIEDFLTWVDDCGGIPSNIPDPYQTMCSAGVVRAAS